MKIVYQNVVWLLLFVAYNYLCLADKEDENVITIGAFFNEENSQAKLPLESVIYKTNTMQRALRYKLETQLISEIDSFKCSKILCNLMESEHGIAGIFGPASPMTTPIIESICSNLEIPHIQLNWRASENFQETDTIINVFPSLELLTKGMAVIVKNLQWRSFVIVYENEDGLIRLQDVLQLQSYEENNKFNTIMVKQLGPGPDYRPLLKEIKNSTETRIILDCKTESIIEILKQAKDVNMLEVYHNYFLSSLDAHTLDFSVLNTTANITTIRLMDPEHSNFQNALSNWNLYALNHGIDPIDPFSVKTETVLMHDALSLFINAVKSLHVTSPVKPKSLTCGDPQNKWENGGFRITQFMKVITTEDGITGPMGFDAMGRRVNFTLYVVEGTRSNVTAMWKPESPDNLIILRNETDSYEALIRTMKKGTVIVSSRLGPPYLMKRKSTVVAEDFSGNSKFEGYSIDLITEIANDIGFKFRFELAADGKYGNFDKKTNAWNGLIKDILDHKADLAICDLTITHQRREVVDFSMPFMRLGVSILYKKPDAEKVNMYAFLDPFSTEVWIYTATLYLAVSVILYFVARMAPGDWENPHPCNQNPTELENIWDIKNCLWLTMGSIMTQGCDILPKGISSRMASSMWWFFSLIMTSSYTANLAAFLTTEKMGPTIDSAEALSKQTKIKYGTVKDGATMAFFRDSNYSTYQRMWTNMQQSKPSVFEDSNTKGVKRVDSTKQGLYAFLMESSQIEYEVERNCRLKQVGNWLDSKGYGIAMPLDYPYRSAINAAILKLQENGKLNELKEKWWKNNSTSCRKSSSSEGSSSELALANVGGVFLVLGIGVGVAFVIAIFEFLWNVRNVSVEEHMSYWEAFKIELLFALNVWITKKRTKPQVSESSSDSGDGKSMGHSILHGAGSFLNMNILNKEHTPSRKQE